MREQLGEVLLATVRELVQEELERSREDVLS